MTEIETTRCTCGLDMRFVATEGGTWWWCRRCDRPKGHPEHIDTPQETT